MGMAIREWVLLEAVDRRTAALEERLKAVEDRIAGLRHHEAPAVHRASRFLERELQGGPLPLGEVIRRAEEAGIPIRSLRRAKARLAVRSVRVPGVGGARYHSCWAMP